MWKHLKIEMFERWEKHWGRWMDDGDAQRQYWQHKRPEIEHQSHFFVQTSWPRRMLGARNNLPLPPFLQKRCKKSRKSLKEQRLEIFSLLLPLTVSQTSLRKSHWDKSGKLKCHKKHMWRTNFKMDGTVTSIFQSNRKWILILNSVVWYWQTKARKIW